MVNIEGIDRIESIRVRVPMTSANLGAGFDTLGLALAGYNYFSATIVKEGLFFSGCKEEFKNSNNLLYKAMTFLFEKNNFKPSFGFSFDFETNIKESSGLGSSATCIVGGLMIGAKILELHNIHLTKDELIEMAIEIEGHGDNVVPAFLGSLTVVMYENNKFIYRKVEVSKEYKLAVLISDLEKKSTNYLRDSLKKEVELKDATYNISHGLMTLLALQSGDKELLKMSMKDKLHEQYRKQFIDNFDEIQEKAIDLKGISLNISGSGPSLLVIYDEGFLKDDFIKFLETQKNNWQFIDCDIDFGGAVIE